MPAMHWIRCANGHVQEDVFVNPDALPACPDCDAPTHITWLHGHPPNDGLFRPMKVGEGKVIESQAELDGVMARAKASHGMDFMVESLSPKQHRAEIEERRHRRAERLAAKGLDEKRVADHREARDQAKREAAASAVRRNEDPGRAAAKAADTVGSLASTVRS